MLNATKQAHSDEPIALGWFANVVRRLFGVSRTSRTVPAVLVFLVIALFCSTASVAAQDGTLSEPQDPPRAYLIDPSGQMTIDEVTAKPAGAFTPFGRALSLGYTADTVWLRLSVDPSLGMSDASLDRGLDSNRLVLRLTNPLLNDVRLYDPLQNKGQPIITGDAHPNTQTELDLSSLTFLLPRGDAPRDVYVSVRTTSSMVFSVVLESVEEAIGSRATYNLFAGVYLGLLVVFFVLAVALRIGRADRVTNMFIVQQALAIIWSLTLMGYTRQYLEGWLGFESIDGFSNAVVILYTFSVCQFGTLFIDQFRLLRGVRWIVFLPLVLFVPLMGLLLVGQSRLALEFNAYSVILMAVLTMLIVLFAIDKRSDPVRQLPRWLVIVFYVLFGFATPLATSVTLQVEPVFQNAFVGFFFTTGLAGLLMSTLLLYRARALAREAVAVSTALSLQQQRSQEQVMFLGMLAHEFKTPLSILKIIVGSGQLDKESSTWSVDALKNLDALLDKCLQTESLMDTAAVEEPVLLSVDALMKDVVALSAEPNAVVLACEGATEIRSDPSLVRIILANLIDNALKYGKSGEKVQVWLGEHDDQMVGVRVTNVVGRAGVPDPAHVFDKYYRASGALSQSGSGLGLYLSKHIARLLGGDLLFQPGKDELWFELRLPRQM